MIINHASMIRFATDENDYSLLEAIVRKLLDKPRIVYSSTFNERNNGGQGHIDISVKNTSINL
jgi:hypothetical protein